jgi:uncharacterized protein YjbI with pentapeptide repeats
MGLPRTGDQGARAPLVPLRPLSWRWALIGAVTVVASIAGSIWWFLGLLTAGESRLDAAKAGLSVGAGVGAVIAFLLAIRRLRLSERVQVHAELDAQERRITELYGKAADQLGSSTAAVRLAGLYALERLAQDNPPHRQTIVSLICAYLRMPYDVEDGTRARGAQPVQRARSRNRTIRSARLAPAQPTPVAAHDVDPREEGLVRRAAQRILTDHLGAHGDGEGTLSTPAQIWPDIRLDLTGATLVDFDLTNARVGDITFYEATFVEAAGFNGTTFTGTTNFACVSFHEFGGYFRGATFLGDVYFGDTSFGSNSQFLGADFHGDVRFGGIVIQPDDVDLTGAHVWDMTRLLEWPAGWKVQMNGDGSGLLVRKRRRVQHTTQSTG